MTPKLPGSRHLRRAGRLGLGVLVCALMGATLPAAKIAGRISIMDKGDRPAEDVGQTVLWLESAPVPMEPVQVEIGTEDKEFLPHVLVVPVGSTVLFPNHDPFNHNVFSQSEENPFDLGLYGRGETRSVKFERAGIVRVYCNVHAQMSAFVIVRDNPYFAQPSSDGSFVIENVPPGEHALHVWHERVPEITRKVQVPASGIADLTLALDARGYRHTPHLNKYGKPYPTQGRRY